MQGAGNTQVSMKKSQTQYKNKSGTLLRVEKRFQFNRKKKNCVD